MLMKVFSIYDVKAGAFITPFFLPTQGMAVRTFIDCCNDENHAFGQHPEDYSLFVLAEFDNVHGTFVDTTSKIVLNGLEAVHQASEVLDENS